MTPEDEVAKKFKSTPVSRRKVFIGGTAAAGLTLAGCSSTRDREAARPRLSMRERLRQMRERRLERQQSGERLFSRPSVLDPEQLYAALPNEQFPLPAIPHEQIDPRFYRREVSYITSEKPGTVIVDTNNFYLYYTMPNQRAMRYGVGLGRAGFEWAGRAQILWKQKWPKWTPPEEMIERQPELEKYSEDNGGMPPGLTNPLGSRALYIFEGNVDTLYRIHGSPEWQSIGKAVSSGCVRMINQDIIDLYERVPTRTPIVVIGLGQSV